MFKELEKLVDKYSAILTKSEKKVILDKEWKILDEIESKNSEYIHMQFPNSLKGRPINGGPKSVIKGASKVLEKIL